MSDQKLVTINVTQDFKDFDPDRIAAAFASAHLGVRSAVATIRDEKAAEQDVAEFKARALSSWSRVVPNVPDRHSDNLFYSIVLGAIVGLQFATFFALKGR